jgi:predicted nucleic acid-binding protein
MAHPLLRRLPMSQKQESPDFSRGECQIEYELIHKSKGYPEDDIRAEISAFRRYPHLDEKKLTSEIILKASELRSKIAGLTYFDSLHASTTLLTDKKIISTDTIYDKVEEIERIPPQKL